MPIREERKWTYYLTDPIVTQNPVFTVQALEQFFNLFCELANDILFKVHPEELIRVLILSGFTRDEAPIKMRMLEQMAHQYPKGVRYIQFVEFLTEKVGHFASIQGARDFFALIS